MGDGLSIGPPNLGCHKDAFVSLCTKISLFLPNYPSLLWFYIIIIVDQYKCKIEK